MKVIEADGEVAVRVWDIARECGVTGPTLYWYFGSREGLVIAAQAERYRRSMSFDIDYTETAFRSTTTAEEFRALFETLSSVVYSDERTPARRVRLSVVGSAVTRPDLMKAVADAESEARAGTIRGFAHGRDQGWLRPGIDLDHVYDIHTALLIGRSFHELPGSGADRAAYDEFARRTLRTLLFDDEE